MGRVAKHNWRKLFLEYNQGRYKNVAEYARKKKINPTQMRDEFRKLNSDQAEEAEKTTEKEQKKQQKTTEGKTPKKATTGNTHPWETLKKQFTDWPEDRLQTYVAQLTARRDELEAIPFEELTPAETKELGQVRRERRAILSNPDPEKKCTAHNHDGSPCRNPAERGKNVCWNHGGAPGSGAKPGEQRALKHGFYAKIFPDDEEMREIYEAINVKSPIDMVWDQIVIQYAQIARAQKLMYVRDQEDIVKHLKRIKDGESISEREWEFQYPWDRHASFLTAQSKAMTTLEKLISRYEAMANEEQRLKVEKLKQDMSIAKERLEIDKAKAGGDGDYGTPDDGFIDALKSDAVNTWAGDNDD